MFSFSERFYRIRDLERAQNADWQRQNKLDFWVVVAASLADDIKM